MLKRVILAVLLTLWAATGAYAQSSPVTFGAATVSESITALAGTVEISNAKGMAILGIGVSGTFVGTLTAQCSADGSTYITSGLTLTPLPSGSTVTSITGTGGWWAGIPGCQKARVTATLWTSGTAVVSLNASSATPPASLSTGAISGNSAASATGSAVPSSASYNGVKVGANLIGQTGVTVGSATAGAVAIVDGSGNQITSFGGGTQFAEDVASANADVGTAAMAVRNDTVTGATSANGDYQPLKSDSAGSLWVNGASGTFPVTGTVTVTDGAGSLNTIVDSGTITAVTTITNPVTVTDGSGALNVIVDSSALPSGAATAAKQPALGTAGASSADVISIQGIASGTAVPVSGSITCSNCSGTGVSVNEDVASANADPGTPAYTVRNNTLTGATSADGDYQPLKSTAAGAIYIAPSFGDTVASTGNGVSGSQTQRVTIASDSTGTVAATQSGTWNVTNVSGTVSLPTGAATSANQSTEITALQLIDNIPNTIGSTTSGQSGVLGLCATTTAAPTTTTAQSSALSCDTSGALRVVGSAGTTQYVEDAAATDGASLVAVGAIRRDTTPTSSAGTAGDNSQFTTDANGRLYTNSTLYTPNGDSAMNDTADAVKSLLVDTTGTALTQDTQATHDGALTPASSTGGLLFGRARSSAPTAVTADDASLVNTTLVGDLRMAQVDSSGAYVTPDTQLTGDGALTHSSTTGSALFARASAAAPTDVSADNDAVMPWALKSGAMVTQPSFAGVLATTGNGVSGTGVARVTIASDSTGVVGLNAGSNLIGQAATVATATTTNTTLSCYITSAASTNATNCKASAGNLYSIQAVNTTATLYYLRLYNLAASPTCSSATGFVRTIPIPASATGAGVVIPQDVGEAFGTGLGFCLTGGGSSTDNTNAATGVYLTLLYK